MVWKADVGGTLTVDLGALRANYRDLRARAGSAECAAVVKANGYGLGIDLVAPALLAEGCATFFVARTSEGVALREMSPCARIFVLDGVADASLSDTRVNGLVPVLNSPDQVTRWRESGGGEPCAVHVDTGMNRLGLRPEQFSALHGEGALDGLRIVLLLTHPACADDPGDPMNDRQRSSFDIVRKRMPGIPSSYCNSPAFLGDGPVLDLVRPGIALYGGEFIVGREPLRPVVHVRAAIVQRREVRPGEPVGYGSAWRATRPSRLVTCAVGYADGYPRSSGLVPNLPPGHGSIAGHRVPIAGRVSMDLTSFDVTDIPPDVVRRADAVELFGAHIPIDEAARAAGTIGYELLTSLGQRYRRRTLE